MTSRKLILLSCFSCSPLWGSEPGVGWRWLLEVTKRHDVVLVTHSFYRQHLEPALADKPIAGLVVYYFAPTALGAHPHKQLNSRLFYIWWQWNLKGFVRPLLAKYSFDLIHHLTWGTFRFPSFLGGLGVPLVMGPLGGGEKAPLRLYKGLPLSEQIFDLLRSGSLLLSKLDPFAIIGPRSATLVLCKTDETLLSLPRAVQARAVVVPEIGAPLVDIASRVIRGPGLRTFRLLYAGRLIGWKGVALALGTMHFLVKAGYDVKLDIAGDGPLRSFLQRELLRLDLAPRVKLLGMIPRDELLALYGQADLFLFPSLHDSSGNVVLESLSRGLPVVCLDVGGPKYYLTPKCGVVVSTKDRSRNQVEHALAEAVSQLLDSPDQLASMSENAMMHARVQSWAATVEGSYELIERHLEWDTI